ncbi:MAG: tRNA (guanosine(37)-N1)-methyltransferase TrmD [Rhodobacteraceae bacterium]|nr:tRNA (guanosine(37)-N1)-methyltransferase TrmD [Paracoccaceae bacterium]
MTAALPEPRQGVRPQGAQVADKTPKSHGRLSISANLTPRDLMTPTPRLKGAWTARVLTLCPESFPGVLDTSLTGRALRKGLWALEPIDLRTFGTGKHRNVDGRPAGGGAGLVMRADVLGRALQMAAGGTPPDAVRWPRVCLSPRGKPFRQADAARFAGAEGMTLLCGRFEGIDQRVIDHFALEELSLGDFILTGGEIAAQAVLDATVRLRPGVLGNAASTREESFSDGLLEHPQYTKPAQWQGRTIPETLLSGNHAGIAKWRRAEAERLTKERRPDLWAAYRGGTERLDRG